MPSRKHTTQLIFSFTEAEIWRPVVGYEGLYEVSNLGRVRSLDRYAQCWLSNVPQCIYKGRILRQDASAQRRRTHRKQYYLRAYLYKETKRRAFLVHVLVLQAFVGPRPSGYQANHRNGNPADNRISNLEWCTPSENVVHAIQHGLSAIGEKSRAAKLTDDAVRAIRRCILAGVPAVEIAKRFGVHETTVMDIKHGRSWKHIP